MCTHPIYLGVAGKTFFYLKIRTAGSKHFWNIKQPKVRHFIKSLMKGALLKMLFWKSILQSFAYLFLHADNSHVYYFSCLTVSCPPNEFSFTYLSIYLLIYLRHGFSV